MRERLLIGAAVLMVLLSCSVIDCRAEIAGDSAFDNLAWEQVYEEGRQAGVVQSICATEDYIICIENITDDSATPDVVSAYYRNDVDENGNAVQPYTLAKRVSDTCWEHGNGMAYNPNTKEIYVSLYTNSIAENRGCIYVMDPETLGYKRTIKISDDYNILGISYKEEANQYVIQTDAAGTYSFKILDENFQMVEDLGEHASTSKGVNFQDMSVDGDYILTFPLTMNMGIGDYLQVYSISQKKLVAASQLDFGFQNVAVDEPESICEIEPGVFLAVVNVDTTDGQRLFRFYKTEVPYYFTVTTKAENGKVTKVSDKVLRGENVALDYSAADGYEFNKLLVNGSKAEVDAEAGSYTLSNIQADQVVQVSFSEIPINVGRIVSIALVIAVAAAGALSFYLVLLHIRRERRRKYIRARRRRQHLVGISG